MTTSTSSAGNAAAPDLQPTDRTRLRRVHERGRYDRDTLYGIIDATPMCHVGYAIDGKPYVTPTFQWREGDRIYWHGSSASRALRASQAAQVCLTVTLFDGMVLARSAFHHSANYRSAMIFGRAEKVADPDQKAARLRAFVEGLYPDRWDMLRPMSQKESKATTVLWMPIEEASAKIRTGQSVDDDEDYALPIWAGVIPVSAAVAAPLDDPRNQPGLTPPAHVTRWKTG